jgi:hypothetical protein
MADGRPGYAEVTVDPAVAERLIAWGFLLMYGWFAAGAVIAVFYHLSLYTFDGEFRLGTERSLDLAVSVLRGLVYFVAWPAVFIFDRTAASRIRLYLRYLDPHKRATDPDVVDALRERDFRIWARRSFLARTELEEGRAREVRTRKQRQDRTVTLAEDSPRLDRLWLLTGIGTHHMAVEELVRLYPEHHLPDEIEEGVRRELRIRLRRNCPRCREELRAGEVKVPGVVYLQVIEPGSRRAILEGWAIEGSYVLRFEPCPGCGCQVEPVEGDLAACGRTRKVIAEAKLGRVLHVDIP